MAGRTLHLGGSADPFKWSSLLQLAVGGDGSGKEVSRQGGSEEGAAGVGAACCAEHAWRSDKTEAGSAFDATALARFFDESTPHLVGIPAGRGRLCCRNDRGLAEVVSDLISIRSRSRIENVVNGGGDGIGSVGHSQSSVLLISDVLPRRPVQSLLLLWKHVAILRCPRCAQTVHGSQFCSFQRLAVATLRDVMIAATFTAVSIASAAALCRLHVCIATAMRGARRVPRRLALSQRSSSLSARSAILEVASQELVERYVICSFDRRLLLQRCFSLRREFGEPLLIRRI